MIGLGNKEGGYTQEDQKKVEALSVAMQESLWSKRAEDALKKSEARFGGLVQSVSNYIFTVEITDGYPVRTSHAPACIGITGYTSEEYDADQYLWYKMVHPDDKTAVTEVAARLLQVAANSALISLIFSLIDVADCIRSRRCSSLSPHSFG